MTVSTQVATNMTVAEVVLHAYQLAGLISIEVGTGDPSWTAKLAFGRTALNLVVGELATYGVQARFRVFHEVTLTAGTSSYTLPTWVADVSGDGAYIPAGDDVDASASETTVSQISQAAWQGLGNRSTTSDQPTLYYVHRGTSGYQAELRVWPVPEEAGTIRLQVQRYGADTLESTATLDLEPFWMSYVTAELGHRLAMASSLTPAEKSELRRVADGALLRARGKANESTQTQALVDHPTGWSCR